MYEGRYAYEIVEVIVEVVEVIVEVIDVVEVMEVRDTIGEKNGIMWEKFPSGGPPPPQFGKPLLSKKKSWVYFSF